MSHTYMSVLIHCVFSTKLRRDLIKPEIQSDLWSFLGGIARKNGCKALMVGGIENHVHMLLSLRGGYVCGEGNAVDQRGVIALDE